ncbi:ribosome biogenesis GTP-binding protein YihA/YsxC [Stomatohabitans albus]|uniref:ribosome biogenesis GTP-binding protein YihA/YsxC n=1 Tax=Stomatohabitans albus TaxID=3110766 RepID=UPI00300D8DFD
MSEQPQSAQHEGEVPLTPRQKRRAKQVQQARAAREANRAAKNKSETPTPQRTNDRTPSEPVHDSPTRPMAVRKTTAQPPYPEGAKAGEALRLTFAGSAEAVEQLPEGGHEVAVIGRSNVGKSSLLNALAGRSQGKNELAHTSSAPGRTRLLNAFSHEGGGQLVDLPGYGYAKTSKAERERWHHRMLAYLEHRKQLALILSLIDGKVGPTEDDLRQLAWMRQRSLPVIVVITKVDKVPATWRQDQIEAIRQACEMDLVHPISSHSGLGIKDLRDQVRGFLVA